MSTARHRFPDSPVFYRRLDRDFPEAVRAEGCWIEDADGQRYLDAAGGAMVANLGHGNRELADAVAEAIGELGYVNGTQFTHRYVEQLAEELVARLPGGPWHVYFLASGSEAIEAAVKLARQVQVERGRPGKWKVIARNPSYHGNTLAALSLSGREHYRRMFGPLLTEFPRIAAPDPYRDPHGAGATGEALERELARQDPATVAAFLAEPIGGSSTGAAVPSVAYWHRVAELCRAHDVLVVADEVMCGVGRTGRFLAAEHFGLEPDVVVLGKGLNGGAVPLSAVAVKRDLARTLAAGSGAFQHAQTYSHTPAITAAGLATLRILRREGLVERVARLEGRLFAELGKARAHEMVGDLRGRGFLAGIELVAERASRRPFPRAARVAERLTARAFENGLIVWPNVGHVDGTEGDLVMLAPPFTIAEDEIVELGRRLDLALAATAAELERETAWTR